MSGSKKGRTLRPYRTGPVTSGYDAHVLLRTEAERIADEREDGTATREMLNRSILTAPTGDASE